jgi:hypothetical protein
MGTVEVALPPPLFNKAFCPINLLEATFMAVITIHDLPANRELDRDAMSSIRGGGAPWVYGWIRPYSPTTANASPVVNFYQVNNYADQMINQIQVIDVNNSAANSNINIALDENSRNDKH